MSLIRNSFFPKKLFIDEYKIEPSQLQIDGAEDHLINPCVQFVIYDRSENYSFSEEEAGKKMNFFFEKTIVNLYFNNQLHKSLNLTKLDEETSILFNSINSDCKIEFYFGNLNSTIYLPAEMNLYLIDFLKRFKSDKMILPKYCCTHFAYEMTYGIYETKKMTEENLLIMPLTQFFNEEELISGDIVYLFKNEDKSSFHFAIYLGHGSYLSLFGISGPLCITKMNELKKAWDTDSVQIVQLNLQQDNTRTNTAIKVGCMLGTSLAIAGCLFFGYKIFRHPSSIKSSLLSRPSSF